MPQTEAGAVKGQAFVMETEYLICPILRQRKGRDIDPNFVSWKLLEKAWALLIFLQKLSGNMVFLWFIPPITGRVVLPLV